MKNKVQLILAKPDGIVKTGEFFGIVLPTIADNLTIIVGRAPSIVQLQPGIIRLIDEQGQTKEKYYISGGVAEVAGDVCVISAEDVIPRSNISLETAQDYLQNSSISDIAFYQMIVDDLTAFPND